MSRKIGCCFDTGKEKDITVTVSMIPATFTDKLIPTPTRLYVSYGPLVAPVLIGWPWRRAPKSLLVHGPP